MIRRALGGAIGILLAAARAGPASGAPALPRVVVLQSVVAFNRHDAEALAALFDPSATIGRLGEEGPAASGRDAIKEFFADQFRQNPKTQLKLADELDLGPYVGASERITPEPGESARESLALFEIADGAIRRMWTMKKEDADEDHAEAAVARQIEKWNEGDLPRLIATYDEGAVIFDLTTGERLAAGEDALRDRFEKILEESPKYRVEVRKRLSLGPWAIYLERALVGPSRNPVETIAVYRVHDDRIRRVWIARP